jgi:hypothetical protein
VPDDEGKIVPERRSAYTQEVGIVSIASGYWTVTEEGLFQFGHSKDHRPDLLQVKVMLSALDPMGMPVATQVVPVIEKCQNNFSEWTGISPLEAVPCLLKQYLAS